MNWLEVEDGLTINLDKVQAIQRKDFLVSTIYFRMGEIIDSVECPLSYETLISILKFRKYNQDEARDEQTSVLQRILNQQRTPVP